MTDYKDLKHKVNHDIDLLHEFTAWNNNHDACRECPNNIRDDRCYCIRHDLPCECPYFDSNYEWEEISPKDYLELLLFADQVLNRMAFVLNGKKYRVIEHE